MDIFDYEESGEIGPEDITEAPLPHEEDMSTTAGVIFAICGIMFLFLCGYAVVVYKRKKLPSRRANSVKSSAALHSIDDDFELEGHYAPTARGLILTSSDEEDILS